MIKRITEKPLGYFRPITHNVMFCDVCGRRITYSSCLEFGKYYCEKCYKKIKNATKC